MITKKQAEILKQKSLHEWYVPFQTFNYSRDYLYFGGFRANAKAVHTIFNRKNTTFSEIEKHVKTTTNTINKLHDQLKKTDCRKTCREIRKKLGYLYHPVITS